MEFRYKNNKKDIQTYAEYIFKNSVFSRKKFIYYNLFFIVFIWSFFSVTVILFTAVSHTFQAVCPWKVPRKGGLPSAGPGQRLLL